MSLDDVIRLAKPDMSSVNQLIHQQLSSDVTLIQQLGLYIINGGGKRIRPLLAVLAGRALGQFSEKHVHIAAIIEFIHTATLLHDDVVDESTLRRGRETANELFGNQASVLVGDFLYSRSFQMMVSLQSLTVMDVLANATNVIAEGEVMQLMNCNDPETTEARYMDVIYCKTARLFEAATQLAAVISERSDDEQEAMRKYGMHVGTAFQLIDDLLDYTAETAELGKNIGDDLAEGKPTLPLIYILSHGNDHQKALVKEAIETGNGTEHFDEILAAIKETGALDYTQQKAETEADLAIAQLNFLEESEFKAALIALANAAVKRKS